MSNCCNVCNTCEIKCHMKLGAIGRNGLSRPQSGHQSEFSSKAANIGRGIQTASQKLLRLSQLAKAPPGPFDDNEHAIAGSILLIILLTQCPSQGQQADKIYEHTKAYHCALLACSSSVVIASRSIQILQPIWEHIHLFFKYTLASGNINGHPNLIFPRLQVSSSYERLSEWCVCSAECSCKAGDSSTECRHSRFAKCLHLQLRWQPTNWPTCDHCEPYSSHGPVFFIYWSFPFLMLCYS